VTPDPKPWARETVYGPNDTDRLCLLYVPRDGGWDFHSIVWERLVDGEWKPKLSLTQDQFQGSHERRRWIANLSTLDPEVGCATVKVAEGNRRDGALVVRFDYSWRTWDLVNNREIKRLKDCASPFDPL
jgi:hypothetical protein